MQILEKTPDLLPTLLSFETFEGLDESAIQWLIERSTYKLYKEGEILFESGQAVDDMSILIQGRYIIHFEQKGRRREAGIWSTGQVYGILPFSRMKQAGASGTTLEDCYVLDLHRDCFVEMVNVSYELTQRLVAVMSSRIRDFTNLRLQDEKMMALGKLSAGLAHELNNPASAMVRSSEELYKHIHATPERFKSVITMRVTPEETDEVNEILFERIKNVAGVDLGIMEREERMDDIIDWLEDHGIDEGEDIAETFVEFGIVEDDLQKIEDIIQDRDIEPLMWWMESTFSLERLVTEIQESAKRIAELITSVKAYSHMDRGITMEATDIHEGLKSTIMMLKHKLKKKSISLEKEIGEDLPRILAYGSELNQVWTNILVNAIEALQEEGTLTLRTYQERDNVCVEIEDNGPGIPEDIKTRVFEPFFTTKGVNEGTGMGLDIVKRIVNRHKGEIGFVSEPGKTVFKICIPVEGQMAIKTNSKKENVAT